jgi:hypothetical protein
MVENRREAIAQMLQYDSFGGTFEYSFGNSL